MVGADRLNVPAIDTFSHLGLGGGGGHLCFLKQNQVKTCCTKVHGCKEKGVTDKTGCA